MTSISSAHRSGIQSLAGLLVPITQVTTGELEELISYEMSDPRIQASGVAEVLISPDARTARVRLVLTGTPEEQRQTIEAVNGARGFIKRELSHRLDIFRMPELQFEAALPAELGPKVSRLLKRVRRGRPREQAPGPQQ